MKNHFYHHYHSILLKIKINKSLTLFTWGATVFGVGRKPCAIALTLGFCPFELISFNFWSRTRVFVATFVVSGLSLSLLNIWNFYFFPLFFSLIILPFWFIFLKCWWRSNNSWNCLGIINYRWFDNSWY